MQLNQITATKYQKKSQRVGRGGKRGTYSGRGIKGQRSRAGRKLRPEWRDVLKRIPKLRGYRFKSIKTRPAVLSLADLNKNFKENEMITAGALLNKGLIGKIKGRMPEVKILGSGELSKKFDLKGIAVSAAAKAKIEKAGGKIS